MRSHTFPTRSTGGFTLLELLFVMALSVTMAGVAVPLTRDVTDEIRASLAARYLSGRLARARLDAVMQSRSVALRFVAAGPDYSYAAFADGNGNGVRTTDMLAGIDPPVSESERLLDKFPGVSFGLRPGLPDVDGTLGTGTDGVRIGTSRIASLSADGTATSGTLYVRGRRSQYAVRVLGATGRVRVFRYHDGGPGWVAH
jgi:type II secretory pathway pseudopilin PulG